MDVPLGVKEPHFPKLKIIHLHMEWIKISAIFMWCELCCWRTVVQSVTSLHSCNFLTNKFQCLISSKDLRDSSSSCSSSVPWCLSLQWTCALICVVFIAFRVSDGVSIVCKFCGLFFSLSFSISWSLLFIWLCVASSLSFFLSLLPLHSCSLVLSLLMFSWHLHLARKPEMILSLESSSTSSGLFTLTALVCGLVQFGWQKSAMCHAP